MPNNLSITDRGLTAFARAWQKQRFAHAYLLWGESGSGKKQLAMAVAAAILCEREEFAICGECPSCRAAGQLQHSNVHLLIPHKHVKKGTKVVSDFNDLDKKRRSFVNNPFAPLPRSSSDSINIEEIRSLRKEARLAPGSRDIRFFILFDIEKLGSEAAHALLKLLEEPPADVRFLLTTSHPEQLLPTIRSRCQAMHVPPFGEAELLRLLHHYHSDGDEQLRRRAVRMAMGSYNSAAVLLDSDLHTEQQLSIDFLSQAYALRPLDLAKTLPKLTRGLDREGQLRILQLLRLWFRDCIQLPAGINIEDTVFANFAERLQRFSDIFPQLPGAEILAIIDEAEQRLQTAGHAGLVWHKLAIALHQKLKQTILARDTA
jgi:DNA polymerase-3 subunit delta'